MNNSLNPYNDDIDKWLESIQLNINEIIKETQVSKTKKEDELVFKKIREQYHLIKLILKIKEGKIQVKGFNHKLLLDNSNINNNNK